MFGITLPVAPPRHPPVVDCCFIVFQVFLYSEERFGRPRPPGAVAAQNEKGGREGSLQWAPVVPQRTPHVDSYQLIVV